VRVGARLTAERLAAVLDTSSATTMLAGARPLAGGSSHRKRLIRDRPIIDFLQKTCPSTLMKVAPFSNITKVVYFLMALDPAPLTWLESLGSNSINSWERL
jgi:hypothetical protein